MSCLLESYDMMKHSTAKTINIRAAPFAYLLCASAVICVYVQAQNGFKTHQRGRINTRSIRCLALVC